MIERIVGVDFGTSTSAIRVRRYQDGEPLDSVPLSVTFDNKPTVPTLIQKLENGKSAYFGDAAAVPKGRNAVICKNFKLDLENPDEPVRNTARKLTAEYLAFMGDTYKHQSESGFLGDSSDRVRTVIGYPVKWSEETRAFMRKAAQDAGFPNVEGMDEARACIQAVTEQYADLLREKQLFKAGSPCTILLIDMGAGTTDIVLCRHTPGDLARTEILSTWPRNGEILFGGAQTDDILYHHILDSFPEEAQRQRITKLRTISGDEFKAWKQDVVSPGLLRFETVDYFAALENVLEKAEFEPITRKVFEAKAADYLRQFPELIKGALEDGQIQEKEVDLAILTGGHSQWYFAREMLLGKMPQFGAIELGRIQAEPQRVVSLTCPQETVARGLVTVLHGEIIEIDTAAHFREAAEQGDADAQYNLGRCYENGRGVNQDYAEAAEWYRKAAEQGQANAQYKLGVCYDHGRGVNQDYAKATEWYRKAAEQGDADAQNSLGECYYYGSEVNRDYAKAVEWYRKAAEQGQAKAQYNLGWCYYNGRGVNQDYAKAAEWYRKAAEQGNADAQYNLGRCYENGRGVNQDYAKVVEWHRKAAEQGNTDAQYNLGWCYENGQGVNPDYAQAVEWYRKAAEQGNDNAQCKLGICYDHGRGVNRDYAKAVEWYRKAAEQGNAYAQNYLGVCYYKGRGVNRDYAKAVEWYRKAVAQGNHNAEYNLGICYNYGRGVNQDYAEAAEWYRKAAFNGDADAIRELEGKSVLRKMAKGVIRFFS